MTLEFEKKRWSNKDKWDRVKNKYKNKKNKKKKLENGNKKVKSVKLGIMNHMCVVVSNKYY